MFITMEEMKALEPSSYCLIDMRSSQAREYGVIPGAVAVSGEELNHFPFEGGKRLIVYGECDSAALAASQVLRQRGFQAFALQGGYIEYIACQRRHMDALKAQMLRERAEISLRSQYRDSIWRRFTRAIREYELIQPGDRIAVCISGGKDSMLMAKLFEALQPHSKVPFTAEYLVMDPGYSPANRQLIEFNARMLNIPIHIFESNIFESVTHVDKSPCYLCARMRRGHLYSYARELGCNKIALGHHYDDVIETILMGMLWGAQIQTMMPKLHSTNFEGMELIRPLYLIHEEDIKAWRDENDLHFIQCACRFTEGGALGAPEDNQSKRLEVKRLIRQMKASNPQVEDHIFRSVENVALDAVIGYKTGGERVHFLDRYNEPLLKADRECRPDRLKDPQA